MVNSSELWYRLEVREAIPLPGCLLDSPSVSTKLLYGYTVGFITCELCHSQTHFHSRPLPLSTVVVTLRVGSRLSTPKVGSATLRFLEVMATFRFAHRSMSNIKY